jgi:hypothetical protein
MKRVLALVVPLLLTGGPALAATPTPHHGTLASHSATAERASREKQPTNKLPVNVVIGSVSPKYLQRPSQTLKLSGQVQNQSDSAFQRLTVRLHYSTQGVQSRGNLQAYADGKGLDPRPVGATQVLPAAVQPGGQQPWALSMPVNRMHLPTKFGVYPISVEVLNSVGTVVGRQRTFITYFPKGTSAAKTKVSWVWPVIDQPHRADDATFVDDRLERTLNTGGRLGDLVTAAARSKSVSWLIDPALADDAAAMAGKDGYTIKGTVHKPQSVAAEGWLNTLRNTLAGKRVIATPYGDPDVMALSHAGMGQDIKTATDAVPSALGRANLPLESTSVAVPPDGVADQQTLANLVKAGAGTILLNSTVLPNLEAQSYTANPLAQKSIGGKDVKLIAYDDTINKVLAAEGDEGITLAEQRFLAETAMITNERPFYPRTLVIVPPRRWAPGLTLAKDLLAFSSGGVPWMRPVTLAAVEKQKPEARTFLPQKGQTGLPKRYLRDVGKLSARARQFTLIFQPPVSGFTNGVARVESSAWSDQTPSGSRLRQTLDNELRTAQGKIRVLNDRWDLAGKSGQVPITISNKLEHGTVKVKLHAYSQNDTRLHVEGPGQNQSEITLEAGHQETVKLYMKAAANGPAYVYLELLGPDGQPFTAAKVLQVRATAYGRTALLITGVSLAVLFVGVGYRMIRRRGDEAEGTTGE